MGGVRNTYKTLVGKPEGKRLFRRSRRKREDNIRMDVREIGWDIVYWIHLTRYMDQWRAFVNTVMNIRFAKEAEYFLTR
jgi:hypothetical protein